MITVSINSNFPRQLIYSRVLIQLYFSFLRVIEGLVSNVVESNVAVIADKVFFSVMNF